MKPLVPRFAAPLYSRASLRAHRPSRPESRRAFPRTQKTCRCAKSPRPRQPAHTENT